MRPCSSLHCSRDSPRQVLYAAKALLNASLACTSAQTPLMVFQLRAAPDHVDRPAPVLCPAFLAQVITGRIDYMSTKIPAGITCFLYRA